jgi:hypothetical protein
MVRQYQPREWPPPTRTEAELAELVAQFPAGTGPVYLRYRSGGWKSIRQFVRRMAVEHLAAGLTYDVPGQAEIEMWKEWRQSKNARPS